MAAERGKKDAADKTQNFMVALNSRDLHPAHERWSSTHRRLKKKASEDEKEALVSDE